jgi:hypothetical protein
MIVNSCEENFNSRINLHISLRRIYVLINSIQIVLSGCIIFTLTGTQTNFNFLQFHAVTC